MSCYQQITKNAFLCPNNLIFLPFLFCYVLGSSSKNTDHTRFIPRYMAELSSVSLRSSSQYPAFISSCTSPELLGHISVKKTNCCYCTIQHQYRGILSLPVAARLWATLFQGSFEISDLASRTGEFPKMKFSM